MRGNQHVHQARSAFQRRGPQVVHVAEFFRSDNEHPPPHGQRHQHAADRLPACQTPLIGLAAVRRADGHVADATALVERLTTMDVRRCDDPWWHYRFGQAPERRARLLLSMRAQVTGR